MFKHYLTSRPYLVKIISNMSWLLFDKVLRLTVGLFVGVWVARYLGPAQYGLINYALAIVIFMTAIADFGLKDVIIKKLIQSPENKNCILGSSFFTHCASSALSLVILLALIMLMDHNNPSTLALLVIGLTLIFKPFDTIRFFFEANTQSKYIVLSDSSSFVISNLIKISLLLYAAHFMAFVWLYLIDSLIAVIFILFTYRYKKQHITHWRIDPLQVKNNIKQCWPLVLSGLTFIVYMRIDQVMLGYLINYEAVGIYTAATKISEVWYFLPVIIMSSVNPTLLLTKRHNENLYYQKLQQVIQLLTALSLCVAVIISPLSYYIIHLLFGSQYQESHYVLIIHIWTGIFISLGLASNQWFVIENLQKLHLYRCIVGAVLNIILNLLLIPTMGVIGAAIATLVAHISASFLYDYFTPQTKRLFTIKLRSFNLIRTYKEFSTLAKNILFSSRIK